MLQALTAEAGDRLNIEAPAGGMQLLARCNGLLNDRQLSARLQEAGVVSRPLSGMLYHKTGEQGLFLGFAAWNEKEIDRRRAHPRPDRSLGRVYRVGLAGRAPRRCIRGHFGRRGRRNLHENGLSAGRDFHTALRNCRFMRRLNSRCTGQRPLSCSGSGRRSRPSSRPPCRRPTVRDRRGSGAGIPAPPHLDDNVLQYPPARSVSSL